MDKKFCSFFKETVEQTDKRAVWRWTRKSYLKKETEGLLMAAQNQALQTNLVMVNADSVWIEIRLSVILYQTSSVWFRMSIGNGDMIKLLSLFIGSCVKRMDLNVLTIIMNI